jgi:hypothetical protein
MRHPSPLDAGRHDISRQRYANALGTCMTLLVLAQELRVERYEPLVLLGIRLATVTTYPQ